MRDVPALIAIWLPALVYPILLVSALAFPAFYGFMQRKEGAIEYLGVVVLLVGLVIGLGIFKYTDRLPKNGRWLKWFYVVSLLGMFVFAGEEKQHGEEGCCGSDHEAVHFLRGLHRPVASPLCKPKTHREHGQ